MKPLAAARQLLEVVVSIPLFAAAPILRPWHTRWGATAEEVQSAMPGDEYLPKAQFRATRAITIEAAPGDVFPWLMQVGFGRAGFYSYDLLDSLGRASAECIVAQWQSTAVGDWVPMSPTINETTAFKVVAIDAPNSLLWRKPDSTWSWRLESVQGGTRLVTRLRVVYDWRHPGGALLSVFLLEFGDFAMMRRMLKGIRRRAEAAPTT